MPQDLPETDPSGVLADTEATVAAIEADAAQKTKAAKAAREGASAAAAGGRQGQRRAAPATGDVRRGVAEPATQQRTFEIDDGQTVAHRGDESWGIMGQTLRMHNSFWNWTDDNYSVCRVVGYAGNFRFASGKAAKHTYIIECEGFYYPATHTCVAGAMVDAGVKRRIRKAPPHACCSARRTSAEPRHGTEGACNEQRVQCAVWSVQCGMRKWSARRCSARRRLGGPKRPNSCQGDPSGFRRMGRASTMTGRSLLDTRPRQNGWDLGPCRGSCEVGRRRVPSKDVTRRRRRLRHASNGNG